MNIQKLITLKVVKTFGLFHVISLYHVQHKTKLMKHQQKFLLTNGVKAIGEGANMPSTLEAIDVSLTTVFYFGPAKAANAGGVAVSALRNGSKQRKSFLDI